MKFYVPAFPHTCIRPCAMVKKGKGQSKVIICTVLKELEYLEARPKFQGNRSGDTGDEVLIVFNIYEHDGHIDHGSWTVCIKFCSLQPLKALYEIWLQLAQRLLIFKILDTWVKGQRKTLTSCTHKSS